MPMKPLTKRELKDYFKVYRDAFPEWDVQQEVILTRSYGPVTQNIVFQSLSYGAYRPECMVDVVGPPDGGSTLLHQMLDVKHRQVERRQHDVEWPKVLQAMKEQFVPNVRKPLDLEEILNLAEEPMLHTDGVNEQICNGLATLNVHLGRDDRAIEWCNRAEASFKKFAETTQPADWMVKQIDFSRQLRDAIREGRGREFLKEASNQSSD